MILPYMPRLLAISLATYFLVHVALGLIVSAVARPAARLGERIRPHLAARFLLVLRLLPAAGATLIVVVACVPSYLWLEPAAPTERVGFACLAAALAGGAMWGVSLARGLRAAAGSRRFLRQCQNVGRPERIADEPTGDSMDAWIVDVPAPLVAIGGLIRPRLVISREVVGALAPEQMAVAVEHERGHWAARDNLKRLSMLLTPGILPFAASSRALERGWRKFSEWAADDRAVAGSERRSFALAAALVRVARLSADAPQSSLLLLVGDGDQLATRVERLLRPALAGRRKARARSLVALNAILLVVASVAAILQSAPLCTVHRVLEHLVE